MSKSNVTTRRWQLAAELCTSTPTGAPRVRRYRLVPLAVKPAGAQR